MLHLYFSNRFETLTGLLISRLEAAAGAVFATAQVIVPSRAVERSLTLAIADRDGICANIGFDYLASWLWRQISRFVVGVGENSPFEAETLTWRIYRALGDAQFTRDHARLESYLRGADDLMRYELAVALASLIHDYSTYREDWLEEWAAGRTANLLCTQASPATRANAQADERWQAALYRRIIRELQVDARHPGRAFIEAIRSQGVAAALAAGLPAQVHLFALPSTPPQHLNLIEALARLIDVHVYAINPCEEYWFDVVDRRRLEALTAQGRGQYLETGNQLLANWGRQTQAQVGLLANLDDKLEVMLFERCNGDSALARLQNSILELAAPQRDNAPNAAHDRSIEVHNCHSLTRELEALQDYLLDLFAGDSSLRPSDILVATPDLEAAAPLVEAVFGTVPPDRYIPYQLTGRSRSTVNWPARTLLSLLSLADSRCEATAVFDLLQQPMVARRFGLDGEDLQLIRGWIGVSGIRWALDAEQGAQFDIPGHKRHTLADGLERLFLGYALPDEISAPFLGDLLPAGRASGSNALALGAFWRFFEALRAFRAVTSTPRSVTEWARCLGEAIANFLAASPQELDDLNDLQLAVDRLCEILRQGGLLEAVPLTVVRAALAGLLDEAIHGGVPTGRVTFTSMAALRTLPFEVICVIGLNDGAFPSGVRAPEYDLMALDPRRGDRQRAHDERNVFLDLVLAARRRLYLSYCGRSIRDNSSIPPSILIAELQSAIRIETLEHPLQSFAPECFAGNTERALRSHNREMGEALRESLKSGAQEPGWAGGGFATEGDDGNEADGGAEGDAADLVQPAFFALPLPAPGPEWREVTLDQLTSFFRNPSRYLLARRMQVGLSYEPDQLLDQEPFTADSDARRTIARRILPRLVENPDDPAAPDLLSAGTELPGGNIGEVERRGELSLLRDFAAQVHSHSRAPLLAPRHASVALDLDGEDWHLSAAFSDLRSQGLVRWKYSRDGDLDAMSAGDALEIWLSHLMLCVDPPPRSGLTTIAITRAGTWVYRPPDNARAILAELLAIYRRGLMEPVHFFPRSAWRFSHAGIAAARKQWQESEYNPYAESADPAYRLAFRGQADPLDAEFTRLAGAVFGPLRKHIDKLGPPP